MLQRLAGVPAVAMVTVVTAFTALISWFAWTHALPEPRRLRITFLDVGQGDAIVIETPGGRTLAVDAGPRKGDSSQGMRVVVPYLRSRGIQQLDGLVLTHPDEDHIGGAPDLLDRVLVRRLFVSGMGPSNATMSETLAVAARRHSRLTRITAGQQIQFGNGVTAAVLHPGPSTDTLADNDSSIVLRVRYRRTSVLLTGDAEAAAEAEMVGQLQTVSADILKLGHHGSRTSTSAPFLSAVHPQAAVVSCGRHNLFGHPHPEVVGRLASAGIPIFRTDTDGAIVIESDGDRLWIRKTVRGSAAGRP